MKNKIKSPFFIVEEFVSPLTCEDIVDTMGFGYPETNAKGKVIRSVAPNRLLEARLADSLADLLPEIEAHYALEIKGVLPFECEWYPQGCAASQQVCENSTYLNSKWIRSNNRDLVGILFLSDYQAKVPFDPDFEVRGGKLQFPTHGFGFNPKRGMLVIFPGSSNFVNFTGGIDVGNLFQVRIPMAATRPYIYNMKEFPGNYEAWFM